MPIECFPFLMQCKALDYANPIDKASVATEYGKNIFLPGSDTMPSLKRTFAMLEGKKKQPHPVRVASTDADRRTLLGMALLRHEAKLEQPFSGLEHSDLVCLLGGVCHLYAKHGAGVWVSLGSYRHGALMAGPLVMEEDKVWGLRSPITFEYAFLNNVYDPRDPGAASNTLVAPWQGIYTKPYVSEVFGVCRLETGRAHLIQYIFKAFVAITATHLGRIMKLLSIDKAKVGKFAKTDFVSMVYVTVIEVFPDLPLDESFAIAKEYLEQVKPGSKDPLDNDLQAADVYKHSDEDIKFIGAQGSLTH